MRQQNKQNFQLVLRLTLLSHLFSVASGQCLGTETFERVSRVSVQGVDQNPPIFTNPGGTVTDDCINRCRESKSCLGFVVDYRRGSCFPLSPPYTLRGPNPLPQPVDYPVSYFEKICLSGPACGKTWMLERVVGFEIEGYDDIILHDVVSKVKCAELCLRERNLRCRSAEYHERDRVCKLSRQDRRTQPLNYRPATSFVHYIENQCAGIPPQHNCDYEEFEEQDLGHPDFQLSVASREECQEACEQQTSFNCRSYTWVARAGLCQLSGDDLTSAGTSSAVVPSPGVKYYQRSACLDLSLSCTVDAMTVKLNTPDPFKGRLFSQDFPTTCKSHDRAKTETFLVINFRDPECGTVDEGGGVYSNVVVVQHHPVVQRRGDKAIKLLCLFQAHNQTVSDSFNFIIDSFPGGGVATAIVNATAPSPKIRLRIVDRAGNDINGARLGEELYLRLDLDDDSVYGILARNLVARSGDNSDSITLLDERGCPVDPTIFPSLQPIPNSRSLQGKFEAFKFSENQVVRFQVNVQFCLEECLPAQCDSVLSYGRKRKKRSLKGKTGLVTLKNKDGLVTLNSEVTLVGGEVTLRNEDEEDAEVLGEEDHVYHEMPLQKEILVETSSVRHLKSGLLPEEADVRRYADLVCTSKEVLIAMVVSAVILQICIILIAIMCVFARRRRKNAPSPTLPGAAPINMTRGYRRSPYTLSTSEDSANTLKTLRTSLRD